MSVLITFAVARDLMAQQNADILFELDFEENLFTPVLPAKSVEEIKNSIDKLRGIFSRAGFNTSIVRNGEVLLITIPCADLFRSNDQHISSKGSNILSKFKLPADCRSKYKVLITVHSDDTGEQGYADDLTSARSNAIDDILAPMMNSLGIISIPYGLGYDEPIKPNDSVLNRASNRRAEIYIIPLH